MKKGNPVDLFVDKRPLALKEKHQQTELFKTYECSINHAVFPSKQHHDKHCIYSYHKEGSLWVRRVKTEDKGTIFIKFKL